MGTKLLCSGYTGYGKILNKKISLTSYEISLNRRLMYSEAMYPRMQNTLDVAKLNRIGNPLIPDFPQIDVNISFETTKQILKDLITHILTKRNSLIKTSFKDNASGFEFNGNQCYIKNFSFSCQENQLMTVNLVLFSINSQLKYENADYTVFAGTLKASQIPFNETNKPMPFWDFQIKKSVDQQEDNETQKSEDQESNETQKDDGTQNDVVSFNFSFNQSLKPIYGCPGDSTKIAPSCYQILFGLPQVKITYSKLMVKGQKYDFGSDGEYQKQIFLTDNQLEKSYLQIYYGTQKLIKCTGAVLQNLSPQLINGMCSIYQFDYNIVGKLSN